jgi:hypothetical protein
VRSLSFLVFPPAEKKAGEASSSPPVPAATSASAAAAPSSSPSGRRGSAGVSLPCVVADCKQPRVARKSYCAAHSNEASAASEPHPSAVQQELSEAIAGKNVDRVKAIIEREHSAELILQANLKGVTPLEQAFTGISNSRACGEVMVAWLRSHVAELEQQLQDAQQPPQQEAAEAEAQPEKPADAEVEVEVHAAVEPQAAAAEPEQQQE